MSLSFSCFMIAHTATLLSHASDCGSTSFCGRLTWCLGKADLVTICCNATVALLCFSRSLRGRSLVSTPPFDVPGSVARCSRVGILRS